MIISMLQIMKQRDGSNLPKVNILESTQISSVLLGLLSVPHI